ncbi:YopX family protein [Lysinibacillus sp. VIII_CA]|uniref:YopX family protein n=1 Tax=Lysinibacillus sp. VIII_CA TaxID=3417452 RepID=UPI003CED2272
MSREIKFRAWDKSSEYMHSNVQSGVYEDPDEWTEFSTVLGLECFEVMQYTGLKDKNGKEIFEGDIVEYNDFNSLRTGGHAEDKIIVGKVAFSCGMWMVKEKNCVHDLYEGLGNDEELEIIGNIYENPELLEETA